MYFAPGGTGVEGLLSFFVFFMVRSSINKRCLANQKANQLAGDKKPTNSFFV